MDTAEYKIYEAFKNEKALKNISRDDSLNKLFEFSAKANAFIYDDDALGYSHFVSDTKGLGVDKTFIVENKNHQRLFFMKIDGVLFSKKSKCDCALLFGKEIDFIEFKTNAVNKTDDTREAHYAKIYNQLKITIDTFEKSYHTVGMIFREVFPKIQAYGVFNPTVPHNPSTEKFLSAKFALETKVKLHFTNKRRIDE